MLLMAILGDYCPPGTPWQHPEFPVPPTANYCVREHFWDDSAPSHPVSLWCPRWQWAAASGTEEVNGGTANPPGAYCGFCTLDYCQRITNMRSLRIRCAVYLLVKGQAAWRLGSLLVKGSICLVQSEIPSREREKATDYKGMTWMEQEQGWSMSP